VDDLIRTELDADGVLVATIDMPGRTMNVFSADLMDALEALIDGVVVGSAVVQVSLDDGRPREVPPGASPGAPGPLSP